MRIAIRLTIVAIVLIVGGILRHNRQQSQTVSAGGIPMVETAQDDPRIAAATAEAKRRYSEFLAAYQNRAGKTGFAVKRAFPVRAGGTEAMWVLVTSMAGNNVTGTIDDQPMFNIGHKEGDSVTLSPDQVEDWVYMDHGQMVGGFSIPVLKAIEAEQKK